MKQTATRDMYRIWTALRGARPAPERGQIDPVNLSSILQYIFLLETAEGRPGRIRLAGTHICSAFDAELRGRAFQDLWRPEDRHMVVDLLDTVRDEAAAVVIGATEDANDALQAEMVLLPLRTSGRALDGVIGACVVTARDGLLRRPVVHLSLETQRVSWPSGRTHAPEDRMAVPALVHMGARREGRFFVYDGGRI